jgi:hypothetical protein
MLSNHPDDIPGVLTRVEVWSRISIAILLGVSLAVAKKNSERNAVGLGSARRGWDAARFKQQRYTGKTYKPGPFDHWTDEELWTKARALIMGPDGTYDEGAWYDLDQAYKIGNMPSQGPITCRRQNQLIKRAVESIRLAKRIYDTGRLTKYGGYAIGQYNAKPIDFDLLAQRVRKAIRVHDNVCPSPYDGPTFP